VKETEEAGSALIWSRFMAQRISERVCVLTRRPEPHDRRRSSRQPPGRPLRQGSSSGVAPAGRRPRAPHRGQPRSWGPSVPAHNGLLRVERSVFQSGGSRSYGLPKNRERREVVLDPHLVSSLRTWRKPRLSERMALGADRDEEDLLFTWEDGRPVPPDHVTTIFGRLTSEAEVPRLRFHELRPNPRDPSPPRGSPGAHRGPSPGTP
jgi:hypothetical protein